MKDLDRDARAIVGALQKQLDSTNGNDREAVLKNIKRQLKKIDKICGAVRGSGKICPNKPYMKEDGTTNGRCSLHGGKSTGAKTPEGKERQLAHLNPKAAMIHGMYSRFVMTHEEESFYTHMINHYVEAMELDPLNIMLLDRALRNFILNQRKEIAEMGESVDETQSYNDYDTKFLRYVQALGLDRKFNESRDNSKNSTVIDIAQLLGGGEIVDEQ